MLGLLINLSCLLHCEFSALKERAFLTSIDSDRSTVHGRSFHFLGTSNTPFLLTQMQDEWSVTGVMQREANFRFLTSKNYFGGSGLAVWPQWVLTTHHYTRQVYHPGQGSVDSPGPLQQDGPWCVDGDR